MSSRWRYHTQPATFLAKSSTVINELTLPEEVATQWTYELNRNLPLTRLLVFAPSDDSNQRFVFPFLHQISLLTSVVATEHDPYNTNMAINSTRPLFWTDSSTAYSPIPTVSTALPTTRPLHGALIPPGCVLIISTVYVPAPGSSAISAYTIEVRGHLQGGTYIVTSSGEWHKDEMVTLKVMLSTQSERLSEFDSWRLFRQDSMPASAGKNGVLGISSYRWEMDMRPSPAADTRLASLSDWLFVQNCLHRTSGSGGMGPVQARAGEELDVWRPQSQVCDRMVSDYCEYRGGEKACACFVESRATGAPQCTGLCAQEGVAYRTKQWRDAELAGGSNCNTTICEALVRIYGDSVLDSGSQTVVCGRRFTNTAGAPVKADVSGGSNTTINKNEEGKAPEVQDTWNPLTVSLAVIGLMYVTVILWSGVLWLRRRSQRSAAVPT